MEENKNIDELNKQLESIDNLFSNDLSSTEEENIDDLDINSIMDLITLFLLEEPCLVVLVGSD